MYNNDVEIKNIPPILKIAISCNIHYIASVWEDVGTKNIQIKMGL